MLIYDGFNYEETTNALLNSPTRTINCKVSLDFTDDTFLDITNKDKLKNITIDRQGERGKFFGFGVAQKATVKIIDTNREIDITNQDEFDVRFTVNDLKAPYQFTTFKDLEVKRDENTNELTITGYDLLYEASKHTMSEIELAPNDTKTPYTLANKIISALGGVYVDLSKLLNNDAFYKNFPNGINVDGTETFRDILDDIAEVTQTIYYERAGAFIFKRLAENSVDKLELNKTAYFTLKSEKDVQIGAIASVTELGDNVIAGVTNEYVVTQYVRNNAYYELATDVDSLLEDAIDNMRSTYITPFILEWRGSFLTEPVDMLDIDRKATSFILCDTITYDGGLKQKTEWSYEAEQNEHTNPSTLGEVLKQTRAKVDKVNREIELVASETAANKENISALKIDTSGIQASVSSLETKVDNNETATTESIDNLKKQVELTMTSEQVNLAISTEMAKGATKVETTTGFTFNDTGLTVSKNNSEISTTITEDGMTVKKNNTDVLTANNEGVTAIDLHAKTFLIIGNNSRIEDYKSSRSACFWIGG